MIAGGSIGSGLFDVWAKVYDAPLMQHLFFRSVHDAVIEVIDGAGFEAPARLVDVGCGTGLLASRLEALWSGTVVGIDFSAGMIARAASNSRSVAWTQGDAMRLPFADGSFDVITCTESFHWYPDQPTALREFRRVLVPGGRLLLALMSMPVDSLPLVDRVTIPRIRPGRWPSPRQLHTLLEQAGLHVDQQHRVSRVPGLVPSVLLTCGRRPEA